MLKAKNLHKLLLAEGCNPQNFSIMSSKHDAMCLNLKDGRWVVYYSERGADQPPLFSAEDEQEACEFFYDHVLGMEHWHLVGFFKEERDALLLEGEMKEAGLHPFRNDIPYYDLSGQPRYRLFVLGLEIFKAREKFADLPSRIE